MFDADNAGANAIALALTGLLIAFQRAKCYHKRVDGEQHDRLADLGTDFLEDTGEFFDTKAYSATAYQERTPLMREIRREGVDL